MAALVNTKKDGTDGKTRAPNIFTYIFRLTVDFLVDGGKRETFVLYAPKDKDVDLKLNTVTAHYSGGGIKLEMFELYETTIYNFVKECPKLDRLWANIKQYCDKATEIFTEHGFEPVRYAKYRKNIEGGDLADAIIEILQTTLRAAFDRFKGGQRIRRPRTELRRRVVAFDLDGTLIKNIRFSWQILRDKVGITSTDNLKRKERFERGEYSYVDWVRTDFEELHAHGLTRRLAREAVEDAKKKGARLTANFHEAIERLKAEGCTVALISGGADCVLYGFVPDADKLFDKIYINKLMFAAGEDGELLDIIATKHDGGRNCFGVDGKEGALKELCEMSGTRMNEAVFVGDDTNDYAVMKTAGLSIFYYSPELQGATRDPGAEGWPHNMSMIACDDLNAVVDKIFEWYKTLRNV